MKQLTIKDGETNQQKPIEINYGQIRLDYILLMRRSISMLTFKDSNSPTKLLTALLYCVLSSLLVNCSDILWNLRVTDLGTKTQKITNSNQYILSYLLKLTVCW